MKKIHAEKYILFLFMVALALVYIVPFLMMGLGSFKNQAEAAKFDLSLPTQWIFSNYTHVLESGKIIPGYVNSLIVTVPVTLISVFLGAISGIVISRRNDKLSHLWSYINSANCIHLLFVAGFAYIWYIFISDLYFYFAENSFYGYDFLQLRKRSAKGN